MKDIVERLRTETWSGFQTIAEDAANEITKWRDMEQKLFKGLTAVVQYCRKDGQQSWCTMAAFDSDVIANNYALGCTGEEAPWEYRVIIVSEDNNG